MQSNYCGVTPIYIDLMARPLNKKDGDSITYAYEYVDIYFPVSNIKDIIESITLIGYTVNTAKYIHDKK